MKKFTATLLLLGLVAFLCGCRTVATLQPDTLNQEESAMSMQTTYQFLKDAGHYYLATVDQDQPRVRPFGTALIFEDKLYIQTGRRKNVAKQLIANGKCEICAMKGDEWIRISGVLVDDNRREPKAAMLDAHPSLKGMYSPDDDNTMVLYFQPGTVTSTIWSFSHDPIVMRF